MVDHENEEDKLSAKSLEEFYEDETVSWLRLVKKMNAFLQGVTTGELGGGVIGVR